MKAFRGLQESPREASGPRARANRRQASNMSREDPATPQDGAKVAPRRPQGAHNSPMESKRTSVLPNMPPPDTHRKARVFEQARAIT
eukprot:2489881-Pyramimonas_sp.AAC.1